MDQTYTIGKLARKAGVPVSTIRYYERAGILHPEGRSEGNYRIFGPDTVHRLKFIRTAKSAGFTLEDITALLEVQDGVAAPCDEVHHLIEHRLEKLDQHLADLHQVRDTLTSMEHICEQAKDKEHCDVLDELSTAKSGGPPRSL